MYLISKVQAVMSDLDVDDNLRRRRSFSALGRFPWRSPSALSCSELNARCLTDWFPIHANFACITYTPVKRDVSSHTRKIIMAHPREIPTYVIHVQLRSAMHPNMNNLRHEDESRTPRCELLLVNVYLWITRASSYGDRNNTLTFTDSAAQDPTSSHEWKEEAECPWLQQSVVSTSPHRSSPSSG